MTHFQSESDHSVVLSLDGLHCINCVKKVEQILASTSGVTSAGVNLTKKQARLTVSPSEFELTEALDRLSDAGFTGRLMSAQQTRQGAQEAGRERTLLLRMAVCGSVAANVMLLSIALYIGQFQGMEAGLKSFFQLVSFLLTTPAVFYGGRHFAEPAWKALRSGRITIDVPITVGLTATYLLSVVSFFRGTEHQYFDTAAAFVFALLVGRYLQSLGMSRVRVSLDLLLGLRPEKVTVLEGDQKHTVLVDDLKVGQVVMLSQGEGVPADGTILQGRLELDEAAMTGESLPVERGSGDPVMAGTKVFSGTATMLVDATGAKTVLSRLGALIEEAQESRLSEGRLAGKIAAVFSASILLLATLVFFFWLPAGLEKATLTAVSVLVITCPCALGLALPLAFWMAVRTGAERGVLVKDEAALETTSQMTDLVLDKTGTVTQGKPTLVDERFAHGESEASIGPLVELMERTSGHPFARTLVSRFADHRRLDWPDLKVETLAGRGREMVHEGQRYFLGNREQAQEDQGMDIGLYRDDRFLAGWRFDDALRPEAPELIESLKESGLTLHLLSGDREDRTQRIAGILGLEKFAGRLLPEDKARRVGELRAKGAVVGLLGDGVNDGPALAAADVGVAMGHASAVASASAPVLLLRPGLGPVKAWLDLGRAYRRTVKSSLILSAVYNLLAVPLAAAGLVSPLVAAIAMPLASVAVVVNSLGLVRRM